MKHGAYNFTTQEVIFCNTSNALRYAVKRRSLVNSRDGIGNKWVFTHSGVETLMRKVQEAEQK